jgi:membrane protein
MRIAGDSTIPRLSKKRLPKQYAHVKIQSPMLRHLVCCVPLIMSRKRSKFKLKDSGKLIKETFTKWNAKDPFRESAVIAYYAVFSLPALLAIVVAIAGLVFGKEAVQGQISDQISAAMSADTAEQVEDMIAKASEQKASIIAGIIGVATLIFGATGVFVQLQKSLNNIWEVKVDPKKQGILATLRSRLFSFGLIVSIGFLMLISLVITSVLAAVSGWIKARWPDYLLYLFEALNFVFSFGVITVMFALMFRILPDAKIKWRQVWIGAALTSFLFVLGKYGMGLYFAKADPASAYGVAGSLVLILLWVSYSSMILFFGAEFTKVYADMYDGGAAPADNAIKVPGLAEDIARANRATADETKPKKSE